MVTLRWTRLILVPIRSTASACPILVLLATLRFPAPVVLTTLSVPCRVLATTPDIRLCMLVSPPPVLVSVVLTRLPELDPSPATLLPVSPCTVVIRRAVLVPTLVTLCLRAECLEVTPPARLLCVPSSLSLMARCRLATAPVALECSRVVLLPVEAAIDLVRPPVPARTEEVPVPVLLITRRVLSPVPPTSALVRVRVAAWTEDVLRPVCLSSLASARLVEVSTRRVPVFKEVKSPFLGPPPPLLRSRVRSRRTWLLLVVTRLCTSVNARRVCPISLRAVLKVVLIPLPLHFCSIIGK